MFQHNGFINVDKKYLDTFLSKKNKQTKKKKNDAIKMYYEDDFLNLPCSQYKMR